MAGRKIEDEAEAIAALDSIARTGLELSEWCRARGIDPRSLSGWRGVLKARGYEPASVPSFVEVVRVPVEPVARYAVRRGAFTVEVDDSFEEATLERLLRVIATC